MEEVFAMKARIKFKKYGAMKFIGHLDIMRYFQKAMRRADIPIAFTSGYSPHMIMSFANPLGVGITSESEYFDIELNESVSSLVDFERLNDVMVEGIEIVNYIEISDKRKETGMSIVAAADYLSHFNNCELPSNWNVALQNFFKEEHIVIVKKTKKSEKEVDIRPMIYRLEERDNAIFMQIATGSIENLKPELVMLAFARYLDINKDDLSFSHHRMEVYANVGTTENKNFTPLDKMGIVG